MKSTSGISKMPLPALVIMKCWVFPATCSSDEGMVGRPSTLSAAPGRSNKYERAVAVCDGEFIHQLVAERAPGATEATSDLSREARTTSR